MKEEGLLAGRRVTDTEAIARVGGGGGQMERTTSQKA